MKNVLILLILLVVCIQFTSCYVPTQMGKTLSGSLGENTDYLRYQFGPPAYILENGEIGEIWVYSETYIRSNPGYIGKYGYYYLYTPPSSYEYEASNRFWVDKSGTIIKYSSKGYTLKKPDPVVEVVGFLAVMGGTFALLVLLFN